MFFLELYKTLRSGYWWLIAGLLGFSLIWIFTMGSNENRLIYNPLHGGRDKGSVHFSRPIGVRLLVFFEKQRIFPNFKPVSCGRRHSQISTNFPVGIAGTDSRSFSFHNDEDPERWDAWFYPYHRSSGSLQSSVSGPLHHDDCIRCI